MADSGKSAREKEKRLTGVNNPANIVKIYEGKQYVPNGPLSYEKRHSRCLPRVFMMIMGRRARVPKCVNTAAGHL